MDPRAKSSSLEKSPLYLRIQGRSITVQQPRSQRINSCQDSVENVVQAARAKKLKGNAEMYVLFGGFGHGSLNRFHRTRAGNANTLRPPSL